MFHVWQWEQVTVKRKLPVYLVDSATGLGYTGSLTGFTIKFYDPGAAAEVDLTANFASLGNGWYTLQLDAGHVDAEGLGYVRIEKTGTIQPFNYPVRIEFDKSIFDRNENCFIDGGAGVATGPTYSGKVLTSGRKRFFKTKAEADAATHGAANAASPGSTAGGAQGEIARIIVSGESNGDGTFKSFLNTTAMP